MTARPLPDVSDRKREPLRTRRERETDWTLCLVIVGTMDVGWELSLEVASDSNLHPGSIPGPPGWMCIRDASGGSWISAPLAVRSRPVLHTQRPAGHVPTTVGTDVPLRSTVEVAVEVERNHVVVVVDDSLG